jgi:dihydroxy-acid dehydratase
VRTGDEIELNVPARTLTLHVPESELAARRATWMPPPSRYERGYGRLLMEQITQADEGCDFRFLAGTRPTPEPDIF